MVLTPLDFFKKCRHTDLFRTIFVEDKKPLRSSDLASLFEVNLSDQDTYKRELETRTLCFWRDWIIDVEGIYKSFFKYFVLSFIYSCCNHNL